MIGSNAEPANHSRPREVTKRTFRPWRLVTATLSALALSGLTGCGEFHMAASNLVISPDPAAPGDMMVASFLMNLLPTQSHTIILIIDDEEHLRVVSSQRPPVPVILQLGDAADLIDRYGSGQHEAHVQVHASDEVARTESVIFQLNGAVPQR